MRVSSPYVFQHVNDCAFTNRILVQAQCKIDQFAALRVLFDCFYGSCGFVPWYDRDDYNNEEGGHSSSESYLFCVGRRNAKHERDNWITEEKKYIRYDAVMSCLGRMSDIAKGMYNILLGKSRHMMSCTRAITLNLCVLLQSKSRDLQRHFCLTNVEQLFWKCSAISLAIAATTTPIKMKGKSENLRTRVCQCRILLQWLLMKMRYLRIPYPTNLLDCLMWLRSSTARW